MAKWITDCPALIKVGGSVLVRQILLISMLLLGTIPQGFMQVADSDGFKVVVCTGNGPLELWQRADGSVSEHIPEDESDKKSYACINVLIAAIGVQSLQDLDWGLVEFSRYRLPLIQRQIAGLIYQTPQQPRAPPFYS